MLAFAGNSLLCRLALKETSIDAASFNSLRLVSGALVLWLIVVLNKKKLSLDKKQFLPALSLFIYSAAFAFSYINLSAATGALLLFGSVQFTMILYGFYQGERLAAKQLFGLLIALLGVTALLLPSSIAPPLFDASLMILAGIAWGAYSLLGRSATDATETATSSFILSLPLTLLMSLLLFKHLNFDITGAFYAVISGAITSGLGYVIWYRVLPQLTATVAASVQLSVPAITALGGAILLAESVTLELIIITFAILGGIALVIINAKKQ